VVIYCSPGHAYASTKYISNTAQRLHKTVTNLVLVPLAVLSEICQWILKDLQECDSYMCERKSKLRKSWFPEYSFMPASV
jgi:hypothetical protein